VVAPARKNCSCNGDSHKTSLTIWRDFEWWSIVAWVREARFRCQYRLISRYHTRRATQAETTREWPSRLGNGKRGICYRWWSEAQQYQLAPQAQPQNWISDLNSLRWLDPRQMGRFKRAFGNWIGFASKQKALQQSVDFYSQSCRRLAPNEALQLTPAWQNTWSENSHCSRRLARLLMKA